MTLKIDNESIKVVFLDFDGVLNSKRYFETHSSVGMAIDSTRLVLLKQIIDATDAKIVLSTSWRQHWQKDSCEYNEIDKVFEEAGLTVYDKTPWKNNNRYDEISEWLSSNQNVKNYVVLDDEPFEKGIFINHFILTSRLRDGLDEDDVKKAIFILND